MAGLGVSELLLTRHRLILSDVCITLYENDKYCLDSLVLGIIDNDSY